MYEHLLDFYIGGQWVSPSAVDRLDVVNPSTEEIVGQVSAAAARDVDDAVAAARDAFQTFSHCPVEERIGILESLRRCYGERCEDFAQAISTEMGAPIAFARREQAAAGLAHFDATIAAAKRFAWSENRGSHHLLREPVGVCALITPWNWPMNQIVCKVAPAIVAGCTVILKPAEFAPLSALLFAEICHMAGLPPGVFNLINGTGDLAGACLSSHPGIDMVSFTGSTRAGIQVARAAAGTVKRVVQELGGKSPNIILPSADLERAIVRGLEGCFSNCGQSCDSPSRMLIPEALLNEAVSIAEKASEAMIVGDPARDDVQIGPLANRHQFDKVRSLIRTGLAEGAKLVTGGLERPPGLDRGFFLKPTVFSRVSNDMTIAREEIFGPVLCIISYEDVDQAVSIANDTHYGLAAYIQGNVTEARAVSKRLRCGQVLIGAPEWDASLGFGGYKRSGNGREYGEWGIDSFCEWKVISES